MISDDRKILDYIKFIYPLCLYSLAQQIYGIIDIVNGSFIGANEMSYIVYIDQVMLIILALANSIVVGVSVLISKRTEEKKDEEIKTIIGNAIVILVSIALTFILFICFFEDTFLKLILAPQEFYNFGKTYLLFRAFNLLFLFINLCLLAVEKARGNTKKVFNINISGIVLKVVLTFIAINTVEMNLFVLGILTILPSIFVFLLTILVYLKGTNPYRIGMKNLKLNISYIKELFEFSVPLFFSLCLFNVGKMLVNVQALHYGVEAVGYLGISNRLVGLMVSISNGVQEGVAILLARYRLQNHEKTRFVVKSSVILNIGISIVGLILYSLFFKDIILYFAEGNIEVARQIGMIFGLELIGGLFLPLANFMNGVLYGYEKTKVVFIISFFRIIVFRNLVLLILSFTTIGSAALGIAMLVSHVGTFIVSTLVVKKAFNYKI